MYRFLLRPKWIAFHLLVLAGIVLMINLGFWQLRRLDERQSFNAKVEEQMAAAPVAFDSLEQLEGAAPGDDQLEAIEWQRVTVDGTFLADEDIRIVNRSQDGAAGDVIVTPFELNDGRIVLVARGIVPIERPATPAPDGEVTISGRLRESEARGTGGLSDPADGDLTIAHRVDIPRLAGQLPGEVLPMYVELTAIDPNVEAVVDGEAFVPQPLDLPDLGDGPHRAYAVQWFIFSACVAIGWVLAVRHSIGTRRRQRESSEPDSGSEPVGGSDDSAVGSAVG